MTAENAPSIETILAQGYSVRIRHYFQQARIEWGRHLGSVTGFTALTFLIAFLANFVPLGGFVNLAIEEPMRAGYFVRYFKSRRADPLDFNDFFKGFDSFLPLFLYRMLSILPTMVLLLAWAVSFFIVIPRDNGDFSLGAFWFVSVPLFLLAFGVGYPIRLIYLFATPLILDREMGFWQAMEASRRILSLHWLSWLGFVLVLDILNWAFIIFLFLVVAGFYLPWLFEHYSEVSQAGEKMYTAIGYGVLIGVGGLFLNAIYALLMIPLTTYSVAAAYESVVQQRSLS